MTDTNDWAVQPQGTAPTSEIINNYQSIISKGATATDGIIVLTHEINGDTMKLMMQEYADIKKEFAHIVPVQTCLNNTTPYKEDIVYPNFAEYVGGTVLPSGIPSAQDIVASSVPSLAVGTAKPSYSVTDLGGSSSAAASSAAASKAASVTGTSGGSEKGKDSAAPGHAAAGVAGAALAAVGGAAALFV